MANQENSFTSQLYRAHKNIILQLDTLGYDVEQYKHFSINDIYTQYQHDELSFMVEHIKTNFKKYVVFHLNKSLRPANLYEYTEHYYNSGILTPKDELCIIIKDNINATMKTTLEDLYNEENYLVTIRNIKSLQFNILTNAMVPPHSILSPEESEDFKKMYNIKENTQIPEISRFDPVAITIGMRPGDICKINRPNKTSIDSIYYRICC